MLLAKLEAAPSDLTNICFRKQPSRAQPALPPSSQGRGARVHPSGQSLPSRPARHLTRDELSAGIYTFFFFKKSCSL